MKNLRKSRTNKILGGVLGGIGEYFDIDVSIIRIIVFIVGLFNPFPVTLLYLILSLIIPYDDSNETETFRSDGIFFHHRKPGQNNKRNRKELKDVEEK
jgi:phage shock protein PspC (stress-responsive transcriptional regulator)